MTINRTETPSQSPPSPEESVKNSASELMDALTKKKERTGLNFCATIGQKPDKRVVILRNPVVKEKKVWWSEEEPDKLCEVARYIVFTPKGPMSAEFKRKVQYEKEGPLTQYAGEDGEPTGRNEAGFKKFLEMAEERPYNHDGFFSTTISGDQLALYGSIFRTTLQADVTAEEVEKALGLSIEKAREPVPPTNWQQQAQMMEEISRIISSS